MSARPPRGRIARPSGCGKKAYSTERAARDDAKHSQRGKGMPGQRMRPYECPFCPGRWHLTKQRRSDGVRENDYDDPFLSATDSPAAGEPRDG